MITRIRQAILTLTFLPTLALAQQKPGESDPRQLQMQAATANGTASLREQVLHTRVNHDLLVSDYLQDTQSLDDLNHVLALAQPVGGARWVDDHTCQIRIELPASQVMNFLVDIARNDAKHSPIGPEALQSKLVAWNHLKFSVVGSSAGGDVIESARPHEAVGKWSEVTDSARRSAIQQARANAAQHVIDGIGPILLGDKIHASDALAQPHINDRMNAWLDHQPVTRIEFLDDLKVSVTVSVVPESMAAAFRSAVENETAFTKGKLIDWPHVVDDVAHLRSSISGTASAMLAAPPTSLPSIVLPLQPPDWVDQQLRGEASAAGGGSRLKIGRTAEANAVGKIREQFLLLHVAPDSTLGDAAKSDPQIQQAVDRAMLHARTSRVDYRKDGSVLVRMSLDLQDAWDELRSNP